MNIATSAPTRIDLAGGTIDIWPLYLFHPGAQTLNAAISLRASARLVTRSDDLIVIQSEDTSTTVEAARWQDLRTEPRLRLLSLLVHYFEGHGITLTTSSESPAGAGIAGSSALNVAVCAALADWRRTHYEPEALLQIAMNVEAQAINVPTGLQDYRPALYGGIAALELEVDGVRRVPLSVDPKELQSRMVLCYTGEPRNSGTNNWDGVGAAIAEEWQNRKRLAPGVTTPAIEQLIARATKAGATAAKVCGAGGGGCMFCYGPPERRGDIAEALAAGGATILDYTFEQHGLVRG